MTTYRKAKIYVNDIYAGILSENENGYEFVYLKEYLLIDNPKPVSKTLPISSAPYQSKTLFSFFDGLIPEGWFLKLTIKTWKIPLKDRFGLLLVSCKDPIGNVSVEEL